MNSGLIYKISLAGVCGMLLTGAGFIQNLLNVQRTELGLTSVTPLENAPPILALTTQALGSFRGLIANALWIRANDLQLEDKFFEQVQLADWITKLEPRLVQVWVVQAWNMAYNISVKLNTPEDRWRWVQRGIELLRDEGLKYNPNESLIYRELAWFFQHKMGAELDEFHNYYKAAWADAMTQVLGGGRPQWEELLRPQSDDAKRRAALLRDKYKLDPARMKAVDDHWGPLDWRLPESHAIYWATLGLEKSKPEQLITLRRVIYQSMDIAFKRGNLFIGPDGRVRLGPNLSVADKANRAYLEMMTEDKDPTKVFAYRAAHKNFLKNAAYNLYIYNRLADAQRFFNLVREKYPDAVPAGQTLTEFAFERATEDLQGMSMGRTTALVQAFVTQSYLSLVNDQEDQAEAYMLRAQEFYDLYYKKTSGAQRIAIPPLEEVKRETLRQMQDPKNGYLPAVIEKLQKRLGLPAAARPAGSAQSAAPTGG